MPKGQITDLAEQYFGKSNTGGATVTSLDEDCTWLVKSRSFRQRTAEDLDREETAQLEASTRKVDKLKAKRKKAAKTREDKTIMLLQQAVEGADWETTKKLAVNGLEKATVGGRNILAYAIQCWIKDGGSYTRRMQGNNAILTEKVVKTLVAAKGDVDCRDTVGGEDTPLHTAAWYGEPEMIKYLLDANATPLVQNMEHETPLMQAERSLNLQLETLRLNKDKYAEDEPSAENTDWYV